MLKSKRPLRRGGALAIARVSFRLYDTKTINRLVKTFLLYFSLWCGDSRIKIHVYVKNAHMLWDEALLCDSRLLGTGWIKQTIMFRRVGLSFVQQLPDPQEMQHCWGLEKGTLINIFITEAFLFIHHVTEAFLFIHHRCILYRQFVQCNVSTLLVQ
jgi:hypothetical protein